MSTLKQMAREEVAALIEANATSLGLIRTAFLGEQMPGDVALNALECITRLNIGIKTALAFYSAGDFRNCRKTAAVVRCQSTTMSPMSASMEPIAIDFEPHACSRCTGRIETVEDWIWHAINCHVKAGDLNHE